MNSLLIGADDIVGTWVHTRLGSRWTPARGTAQAVIDNTGKIIAGVTYTDWNGANVMLDIAAEPKSGWFSRPVCWALLAYPFNVLGAYRCTALVADFNLHSRHFVERLGFEYEAELGGACKDGNILVYRMDKNVFKDWYSMPAILPNIIKAP